MPLCGSICEHGARKYLRSWFSFEKRVYVGEEGEKPDEHYEIGKQIGEGSFGSVHLAKDKSTGKTRVVKTVNMAQVAAIADIKRFRLEVQIQCELDHPNVARIYAVFEENDHMHIAMQACMGGDLEGLLLDGTVLGEKDARDLMRQAMNAVRYMHQNGYAHRDIKLENFLLQHDPEQVKDLSRNRLSLIDFGFAQRFKAPARLTTKLGTPWYTAPEVVFDDFYNELCDVWSCGVLLYLLLSGSPPFTSTDHRPDSVLVQAANGRLEFNSPAWEDISAGAKFLIRCMIKVDVDRRFTAAQALNSFWMQKEPEQQADGYMRLGTADGMRSFSRQSELKRSCLNLIAYQLDPDAVEELQQLFVSMDKSGDGTLTFEEMKEAMTDTRHELTIEECRNYFEKADIHHTGVITYTEFLASLIDLQSMDSDYACKAAFERLDTHNAGHIDIGELKAFLSETESRTRSGKLAKEAIQALDVSADGKIEYPEFMDFVKSNTEGRVDRKRIQDGSQSLSTFRMKKAHAKEAIEQSCARLSMKMK